MCKLYYFCEKNSFDKALRDGINIKNFENKRIGFNDVNLPVITAYLSPLDNKVKKNDLKLICLELDVDEKTCYAADKDLWDAYSKSTSNYELRRLYYSSIKRLDQYRYGDYRVLEVLICNDIKPEHIRIRSNNDDRVVNLFRNEFNPYYGIFVEELVEQYGNDYISYIYCESRVSQGLFEVVNEFIGAEGNIIIYYDRINNRCISIVKKSEWQIFDFDYKRDIN